MYNSNFTIPQSPFNNFSPYKTKKFSNQKLSPHKPNNYTNSSTATDTNHSKTKESKTSFPNSPQEQTTFFEILGLKFTFDDFLLICILIFLYQEGINDTYLFISLLLLLLS